MSKPKGHQAAHGDHPTPKVFWKVAGWLAVLTALEVWVIFIEALKAVVAPILLTLSAAKFVLVVAYFMHLRWDARSYTGFFAFGFLVAVGVYLAVFIMSGPAEGAALVP